MADLSLDMSVLRMLKTRKRHERFAKMVPEGTVNDTTKKLILRFGEYFAATDAEAITFEGFWPFMRSRYPTWKDKDTAFWKAAIKPIDKDNPPGYDETVIQNLLATDLGNKAVELIQQWQEGGEFDMGEALREVVERYEEGVARRIRTPDVTLGWDEMLEEEANNEGLQWRLNCVAAHLRALRPGDFGIYAMRPDRGKTTWVAQDITHFAPQLKDLEWARGRKILWLNNEGPGRRILARIRTAGLGLSTSEVREIGWQKAREQFAELIGGEDVIEVKDIHGFKHYEVEELIRKINPAVVVFDMIDNIAFTGGQINNGERTDQILEAMYQWARSLGVRYNFVGLATSQISADGEGVRYPPQTALKDSKTGKQGACDFILTGGYDASMPLVRFIGTTKNKIKREGASGNPQCQVWFDMDRGRFKEPEEE